MLCPNRTIGHRIAEFSVHTMPKLYTWVYFGLRILNFVPQVCQWVHCSLGKRFSYFERKISPKCVKTLPIVKRCYNFVPKLTENKSVPQLCSKFAQSVSGKKYTFQVPRYFSVRFCSNGAHSATLRNYCTDRSFTEVCFYCVSSNAYLICPVFNGSWHVLYLKHTFISTYLSIQK